MLLPDRFAHRLVGVLPVELCRHFRFVGCKVGVAVNGQDATSCASRTSTRTCAMAGRSSGEMKIRERRLVIARTVMLTRLGSLHWGVLATMGSWRVVYSRVLILMYVSTVVCMSTS